MVHNSLLCAIRALWLVFSLAYNGTYTHLRRDKNLAMLLPRCQDYGARVVFIYRDDYYINKEEWESSQGEKWVKLSPKISDSGTIFVGTGLIGKKEKR